MTQNPACPLAANASGNKWRKQRPSRKAPPKANSSDRFSSTPAPWLLPGRLRPGPRQTKQVQRSGARRKDDGGIPRDPIVQ